MRLTGTVTAIHPEQHFCIITRDDGGGDVRVPLITWDAYRCAGPYLVGQRFNFLVTDGPLGPVGVNLCALPEAKDQSSQIIQRWPDQIGGEISNARDEVVVVAAKLAVSEIVADIVRC